MRPAIVSGDTTINDSTLGIMQQLIPHNNKNKIFVFIRTGNAISVIFEIILNCFFKRGPYKHLCQQILVVLTKWLPDKEDVSNLILNIALTCSEMTLNEIK